MQDTLDGNVLESRVVIRDIAALAGVSVATVSRVLNGRPDVSSATRNAVLRHIHERGYVTSRNARALAGGRTGLIGLTVPYMVDHYFAQILTGATEAVYERDARLVVCPTRYEHDREVSLLERLMHGTTDGALLVVPSETPAELAALRRRAYPFVVVDPPDTLDEDIPVVCAAGWSGARSAMEHLIALGHTRIGAITGPQRQRASRDRMAGYGSALLTVGLPIDPALAVESDFSIDGGYRAALHLLSQGAAPTAIFAFNDKMAVGVLRAARTRELDVPGQLSVIGFDDLEMASLVTPELTTVRQPLQEIGRVAASVLYRLLDGQQLDATRIELSTRLIPRASTAAAVVSRGGL